MRKFIVVLGILIVLVVVLLASITILSKYHERVAAKRVATAVKEYELREQRKLIAQQSPSVEEALADLHAFGATGVEAVSAILEGRNLSVSDSKSEVIKSNKWESEEQSIERLKLIMIHFE